MQLKAIVTNARCEAVVEEHVQFDTDLPEFRTHGGVHSGPGGRVTSPTLMWVKALDLLLDRIKVTGVDLSSVVAISGSGQQHGSVYWRIGARQTLTNLKHDRSVFLHSHIWPIYF